MQVIVNGREVDFDEVEAIGDISTIARQFTLVEVSDKQNYFKDDIVEIYDDSGVLFIKAEIEYIESNISETQSEFIYAGRNNAKFIVDCYADKTTQFTQNQKVSTVLGGIASQFGLKIEGDAQLPQQEIKTIIIGEKIIDAFIEIAGMAEKIIISDAVGNLQVEFQGEEYGDINLQFGVNIDSRKCKEDSTQIWDKYTIIAQSNYLVEQTQNVSISGSYGSGMFHKVKVVKHTLTASECDRLAEFEYKKDVRKSFGYTARLSGVYIELNKKYLVKDEPLKIDEYLNCKTIKLIKSATENYTEATFEKVIK